MLLSPIFILIIYSGRVTASTGHFVRRITRSVTDPVKNSFFHRDGRHLCFFLVRGTQTQQ